MSTPLKQGPDEHLSNLRHRLRTPLNHVIGYSDLLLEDSDLNDESARHELKVVRDNAQLILNLIQQWLAPGGELTAAEKIDRLRYEILAPLDLIIGSVGSLTQRLRGESLRAAHQCRQYGSSLVHARERCDWQAAAQSGKGSRLHAGDSRGDPVAHSRGG
jgi:signal transduction histidine kinase